MEFQSIMDCHAYGRKEVRPLDVLVVYRKALAEGSVRLRIYDTLVRRARRSGRQWVGRSGGQEASLSVKLHFVSSQECVWVSGKLQ